MPTYRVAVIPGDGIGREVVPSAQRALERTAQLHGFSFEWAHFDWGCEYYEKNGQMLPDNGLDRLRVYDAIFLGAIGSLTVPDSVSLWGLLLPIGRRFHQYINCRPIRLLKGIQSPFRVPPEGGIDFVVIRENTEGEYSDIGGRLHRGAQEELAVQQSVFTRAAWNA